MSSKPSSPLAAVEIEMESGREDEDEDGAEFGVHFVKVLVRLVGTTSPGNAKADPCQS